MGTFPSQLKFADLIRNTAGKDGNLPLVHGKENWHGAINHNNSIWIKEKNHYFVLKSTKNKLSFNNMIVAGFKFRL